jgi:hypothetical protein
LTPVAVEANVSHVSPAPAAVAIMTHAIPTALRKTFGNRVMTKFPSEATSVLGPMMFIFFMFVLLKLSHFPERCAPVEMSRSRYMRSPPGETISPNTFNFLASRSGKWISPGRLI